MHLRSNQGPTKVVSITRPVEGGPPWNTVAASLAGKIPSRVALAAPPAKHAKNGDTIAGQGIERTPDCNEITLLVNGTSEQRTVGTRYGDRSSNCRNAYHDHHPLVYRSAAGT